MAGHFAQAPQPEPDRTASPRRTGAGGASPSRAPSLRELWRRGQRGWPASSPIAQLPNPPLLFAAGAWTVDKLAGGSAYARAAFLAGLSAWAWQELTGGVNGFRRALGAGGLVYVVVTAGAALANRAG